jgi:phosphoribosyl-ATP pyrophosphohydrolase
LAELMRGYLIAGALAVAIAAAGGAYFKGRHDGRMAILDKLKDERIEILLEGKEIDDEVLAADDADLCALLGGC